MIARVCKNPAMPANTRHRVAVLVRHGVRPMELGLIHQLFGQARSAAGEPLYDVVTCALEPGAVRVDADFSIDVRRGVRTLARAGTVLIPASHDRDSADFTGRLEPGLADALARIGPDTRIASVCTGAFVLAAAGLLDGKRATTHWQSAPQLRAWFPNVTVDPDVLYTEDGNVFTSAGEAAGIDLCLHLIRTDHGSAVANEVARAMVVAPHREGGQAQFIRQPVIESAAASTADARAWALRNLDRPLPLARLAAKASMSVRGFSRHFRDETGLSPGQWLIVQRVERARELLEETDLPVERVAERAGFGTVESLRLNMHARLGTSPGAYRRTFRGS
jgi:transcriptional regulator GlxA family with amidase domain